jgi:hypothetical protein
MNAISRLLQRAALLAAASATAFATAGQLAPRESTADGVTVVVTPMVVASGERVWQFRVALNTHSRDLSEDLMQVAVLADGQGGQSRALSWDGDKPGGHHRSGILKFRAPSPMPDAVEVRIARPGEVAPRVFSWRLKP